MNRYYVLTLFPEMIQNGLGTSITGRAIEKGTIGLEAVNIRDYAGNKHGKVDDYPYGGGAGMVMQAEPVYQAWKAVTERIGRKPRVIYVRIFVSIGFKYDQIAIIRRLDLINQTINQNPVSAVDRRLHGLSHIA